MPANNSPLNVADYYQFLLFHLSKFERDAKQADIRSLIPKLRRMKLNRSVLTTALRQARSTGPVLEFGVFKGVTMRHFGRLLPNESIYGFDSFEGFPDDGRGDWRQDFSVDGLPKVPSNVTLVKGYFEDTIPEFRKSNPNLPMPRLIHIDCDIYSSTKTIFEHCDDLIEPGTVLCFDELLHYNRYPENEFLALYEFLQGRDLSFEWVARAGRLMPFDHFLEQRTWTEQQGMFSAMRANGFQQAAAVKIINRPADLDAHLTPFRAEAEILAEKYPTEHPFPDM